ncbi:MAG: 2-amino-4-hydroxy-6-hydroxymethyldihydropteridine diphosphokinase [Rhizobiaceae bacterium]
MKKVWLGLGGNIGDVTSAMGVALRGLDAAKEIKVARVSSVYKTPPWGVTDQPWFHNCCAEIQTSLAPEELLDACQAVEKVGKRERVIRWGPRTIDVDILLFEGVMQTEPRLTIPHPRMMERAFVLVPLAEIAPDISVLGRTCANRVDEMESGDIQKLETPKGWWR